MFDPAPACLPAVRPAWLPQGLRGTLVDFSDHFYGPPERATMDGRPIEDLLFLQGFTLFFYEGSLVTKHVVQAWLWTIFCMHVATYIFNGFPMLPGRLGFKNA